MAVKIAINGYGRIGKVITRICLQRDDVELVAINDTTPRDVLAYLTRHDSVHGEIHHDVRIEDEVLHIDDYKIKLFNTRDLNELDFASLGVDIVIECTGAFLTQKAAQPYLDRGIEKVIFSAPAKDDTPTYVMGVNNHLYKGEPIISNASCTTNCLGPICKVLDDEFGIEHALMTTIHSYTNDQNILDVKHPSDRRRARAAASNMVPTTTGAAKAMRLILPHLDGKIHGQSVRVPTVNVSMVDLNAVLKVKELTANDLNEVFKKASKGSMKGIMEVDEDYKVSMDFRSNPASTIVAADLTQSIGNMIKIMAWYDNEWGYSSRLLDLAVYTHNK